MWRRGPAAFCAAAACFAGCANGETERPAATPRPDLRAMADFVREEGAPGALLLVVANGNSRSVSGALRAAAVNAYCTS